MSVSTFCSGSYMDYEEPPIQGEASFPRLGQVAYGGWGNDQPYRQDRVDLLAKFNLVIWGPVPNMNMAGNTTASVTADIRAQQVANGVSNPMQICYVGATEVNNFDEWQTVSRVYLTQQTGPGNGATDWFARTSPSGELVTGWKDPTVAAGVNIAMDTDGEPFCTRDSNGDAPSEWMAKEYDRLIVSPGTWEGVFMDVMTQRPLTVPDWNGDGTNDSNTSATVRDWWTRGQVAYYNMHKTLYPNHLMFANIAGWDTPDEPPVGYGPVPDRYKNILEGGLFEHTMALANGSRYQWQGWSGMMNAFFEINQHLKSNKMLVFHQHSFPNWDTNYQAMREGLCSCLLTDGYFAYGKDDNYNDHVWFDEYDVDLGQSIPNSVKTWVNLGGTWTWASVNPETTTWPSGVYRREFDNGMAIVNPKGNGAITVTLETDGGGNALFKRFDCTQSPYASQAPGVNYGADVISLPFTSDADGIILLRK